MNRKQSPIYLCLIGVAICLFTLACSPGTPNNQPANTANHTANAGNTNKTGNNQTNQGGTGNPTPPGATGAPVNISVEPVPERGPVWHPLWLKTASVYGGAAGKQYIYTCPPYPNGRPAPVKGTDTYTIGSSICTAAVHAGLITLDQGGAVTFEIRPGEKSYSGSTRNGVTSDSAAGDTGTMNWSFVFIKS